MALLTNINGKFSVSDAGAVTFNNAFTFPTADGTANYVLKTNGSGVLNWAPDTDYDYWILQDDSAANVNINSTNTLKFVGGTYIDTSATWAGGSNPRKLTINHENTTRSDTTSTDTPAFGGTFEAVTSITTNTTGHVTAIDVSTVTIPSDSGYVTGSGTLNKVVRWTATGSTVGDGPITFSSNDSTFSGTITAGNGTQAINADADLTLRNIGSAFVGIDFKSNRTSGNIGGIRYYGTASDSVPVAQLLVETDGQLKYYNGTNGAQSRLTINSSGNAIFTGLVSGITPTAAANFATKAYVDGVGGSYLPLSGGTMSGTITMSGNTISMGNGSITNINSLSINDPGVGEGIQWNGGNGWAIYESPNALTNAAGNLQFVQASTRVFTIEDATGNIEIARGGINKGAIIQQGPNYTNKRFSFDTLVSNSTTAYMILCKNTGNQDVNGIITMDRTSGLRHACSIQVLISSGSALAPVGGLKTIGTAGNGTPFYSLVTCDYDDGTGSSSHIAVEMTNPDGYYETSGAYFTGRIVNSNDGVIVPVLPAAVSNVAVFQSNTAHNFQGNLTVNQGNIGVKNSNPIFAVNTNLSMEGSSLAYLNGTSANQTVTNNIGVTHSSSTIGSGSQGGLYLANNNNSNGAPSPIIFFSAKSASNTYNHAYAAIYGVKTASGADSNWNRGELIFATGDGTGPRKRMTIDTDGDVTIHGSTSGGSVLNLNGGVAPNGVAEIISTSTGVGGETKKLSILNTHFAFDHGSGSSTTFIGLGNYEIDARGGIIGQNMYAQGSTVGITSGGSFVFGASTSEGVYISRPANTTEMNFYVNSSPRITIESGGQVGINNTGPSATLHLTSLASNGVPFKLQGHSSTTVEQQLMYTSKAAATNWYWIVAQAASVNQLIIYGNGDIKNKNNSYGQISDVRLKENIVDAKPKLEDIKKLKVKNFNLIGDDLKQIGLIAQEVEEVFPGLVNEDKEPDIEGGEKGGIYKSVKYSVLVPILIKAMQEQQEIIDDLKSRIEQLEN